MLVTALLLSNCARDRELENLYIQISFCRLYFNYRKTEEVEAK